MSTEKFKSENYQSFGGINTKISPYLNTPMEFLDLQNLDFQIPGSLSERWGSTQYIGQTFAGPVNSSFEFSRLDGTSFVILSHTGGIWFGATTGNLQGVSLTGLGSTSVQIPYVAYTQDLPPAIAGNNWGGIFTLGANYLGSTFNPVYGAGETFYINPIASNAGNIVSYAALNNWLFLADGNKFLKFDGSTMYPVGLPPPLWATNGTANSTNGGHPNAYGSYTDVVGGASYGFARGDSVGTYYVFASYVNNRGFQGPIWPYLAVIGNEHYNATVGIGTTAPVNLFGVTMIIATPMQYGISAINFYCFYDPYNTSIGQTFNQYSTIPPSPFISNIAARFWNLFDQSCALQTVSSIGSSIVTFGLGTTVGGQTMLWANSFGQLAPTNPNDYIVFGLTIAPKIGSQNADYDAIVNNLTPQYLETHQNRLFLSGLSATPSSVWFSDIAEPEGYKADWNFEVRTNDGDVITGIKSYQTRLYIFKNHSFHVLTGDSPENFFVQQISDQYGCYNNRSIVTYENVLLFLDRKGVIMWNGANLSLLSNKVQSYFDRVNQSAAKTTACAVHDKLRNQVIFAVPVDGSSTNNLIIVYDYMAQAWTTYTGIQAASLQRIYGKNNTRNPFYGDYNGRLNWFGSSFLSDNGVGFTTYLKSRFLHDMGDSTQKMFRRLYLNVDSPASSTLAFNINFYQDYGSSVVLSTSLVLSQFQNRIDFGISARSVAFELANIQTTIPLKIHGFTVESRYLRRV